MRNSPTQVERNLICSYLSHALDQPLPAYGNSSVELCIEPIKSLANGDLANTFAFRMENHWGTHIDAPAHFFQNAPSICDYPAAYWLFQHPQVIELSVSPGTLIDVKSLRDKIYDETDLLMIKTGFERWRGKALYSTENPGVRAEVGLWLRDRYGKIRALGFDFVSLSSYVHREEGRAAHRAFLDPNGIGNSILLIEDMHLEDDLSDIKQVCAFPLLMKGLDSAPCTVVAYFHGAGEL